MRSHYYEMRPSYAVAGVVWAVVTIVLIITTFKR